MSFTLIGSIIPINSTLEKKQEAYPSFNVKIAVWTASSSSISSVYLQETSMFISCKKKEPTKQTEVAIWSPDDDDDDCYKKWSKYTK